MKLRLTDLSVKKLSLPAKGQITYWDATTPGFGLRCSARSKSFVVMFGERRRLKTLGRYPDLPLADARRQAKRFLATAVDEAVADFNPDYSTAVENYLQDCRRRLRPSTLEGYKVYLKGIQLSGRIDDISQGDLIRAIESFTSSPSGQNYAFTTLKVFFNWAMTREYVSKNPLALLKRPHSTRPRDRVLSDSELKILLSYTRKTAGRYCNIVTLLALTGQRRGEISRLAWSEIDGDAATFPSERTKNKRKHVVPLGPIAVELLSSISGGSHYVFGLPEDDRPFNGWSRSHKRLLRETELEHFTLHDLRRTFATVQARLGTPIHVTERLLNHSTGTISGVAAVYNRHDYFHEMKEAVNRYDEFISDLKGSN